ncbi:MAG: hypothetical protein ACRBCK_07805 [Alphaproteobacteria bacterium]
MGDIDTENKKSSKLSDITSGISLYASFPLGMAFGAGDRILKPKDDPTITGWKKTLQNNPVSRVFTACVLTLGLNQGIQQGTGLAFDDAEEYLKQAGYPQHVISEFSDDNIKVRHRNRAGIAHTAHDAPPLISLFSETTNKRLSHDAIPSTNGGLGTFLNMNKWLKTAKPYVKNYLNQFVTLPREDATSQEIISQLREVPEEFLSSLDANDEKLRQAMVLYALKCVEHENEGEDIENSKVDALVYAFETVSDMHDDPSLKEMIFPIIAIDYENMAYDNALAFDAKLSGKPIPDVSDVKDALMELYDLFPDEHNKYSDDMVSKLEVFQDILEQHSGELSPLAHRRAEIFVEGAKYFSPELFSQDMLVEHDQVEENLNI